MKVNWGTDFRRFPCNPLEGKRHSEHGTKIKMTKVCILEQLAQLVETFIPQKIQNFGEHQNVQIVSRGSNSLMGKALPSQTIPAKSTKTCTTPVEPD